MFPAHLFKAVLLISHFTDENGQNLIIDSNLDSPFSPFSPWRKKSKFYNESRNTVDQTVFTLKNDQLWTNPPISKNIIQLVNVPSSDNKAENISQDLNRKTYSEPENPDFLGASNKNLGGKFDLKDNLSNDSPTSYNSKSKIVPFPTKFKAMKKNDDFETSCLNIANSSNHKEIVLEDQSSNEKPQNISSKDLDKNSPFETIMQQEKPDFLTITKRNVDVELMNDNFNADLPSSCDSKSKIVPFPAKIRMIKKIQNLDSNLFNLENCKNNKKFTVVKESKSFLLFRFFKKVMDYLYTTKNNRNYLGKYQVLIRDFQSNNYNQYQLINFIARLFLISVTVVTLYGHAFLQMTIISIINLIYLVHIFSFKPYRKKLDFYFSMFNEICLNGGFFAAYILAYLDIEGNLDLSMRIDLGWVYVFSYISLMISLICGSIVKIFYSLKYIFRLLKKSYLTVRRHNSITKP